jgi:UDP-N-acetylglucosamine 1-carboxyvinyltransferase
MDKFVVKGPCKLRGSVAVSGSKNAVLPLIAASLLTSGKCVIEKVPELQDVRTMVRLLEMLGAQVSFERDVLTLDTSSVNRSNAPYDLVRTMRASIYVLGPLAARYHKAEVSLPGGCAWGPRPIDLHLKALEKMGARIDLKHGYIHVSARRLKGAEVVMPISSVGATANTLMAASLAHGTTVIRNAALEPEIGELGNALIQGGVEIEGINTQTLVIKGKDHVEPFRYRVFPDRIETGTFVAAAAATGGRIEIESCNPSHLESVLDAFRACGVKIESSDNGLLVEGPDQIEPTHVVTREYPGFPTDMQAQMMAVLSLAKGSSTVKDTIYPDRFTHVPELRRLGANIRLDGNLAVITGVDALEAAPVMATDIRASSALVIAALAARGTTEISRVYHLDRGYEQLENKLSLLGANIKRISE